MGGIFSGRKHSKVTKPLPEQFIDLDIRKLHREQLLEPAQAFKLHQYKKRKKLGVFSVSTQKAWLELSFAIGDKQTEPFTSQIIEINWTPCNFGGHRPWFLCPRESCGRRVAILFGPHPMRCRQCWEIAYQSQRENKIQRMFRRLRSIEASYTGQPNDSVPKDRTRPKGMHHRTFELLQEKHQRLITDIQFAQIEELRRLDDMLPDWA